MPFVGPLTATASLAGLPPAAFQARFSNEQRLLRGNSGSTARCSETSEVPFEAACPYTLMEMLAGYDARNPKAFNRLVAAGAQLVVLSPDILMALRAALEQVLDEEATKSEQFKRVLGNWRAFRAEQHRWFSIADARTEISVYALATAPMPKMWVAGFGGTLDFVGVVIGGSVGLTTNRSSPKLILWRRNDDAAGLRGSTWCSMASGLIPRHAWRHRTHDCFDIAPYLQSERSSSIIQEIGAAFWR